MNEGPACKKRSGETEVFDMVRTRNVDVKREHARNKKRKQREKKKRRKQKETKKGDCAWRESKGDI